MDILKKKILFDFKRKERSYRNRHLAYFFHFFMMSNRTTSWLTIVYNDKEFVFIIDIQLDNEHKIAVRI